MKRLIFIRQQARRRWEWRNAVSFRSTYRKAATLAAASDSLLFVFLVLLLWLGVPYLPVYVWLLDLLVLARAGSSALEAQIPHMSSGKPSGQRFTIFVAGLQGKAVPTVVLGDYTIGDVLSQLRQRHLLADLKRLRCSVYHDTYQSAPLGLHSRLSEIGVGPLSSLHIRFQILGGARGDTPGEYDDRHDPGSNAGGSNRGAAASADASDMGTVRGRRSRKNASGKRTDRRRLKTKQLAAMLNEPHLDTTVPSSPEGSSSPEGPSLPTQHDESHVSEHTEAARDDVRYGPTSTPGFHADTPRPSHTRGTAVGSEDTTASSSRKDDGDWRQRARDDIAYLRAFVHQRCLTFAPVGALVFQRKPDATSSPYQLPDVQMLAPANTGPHALSVQSRENALFLEQEEWLVSLTRDMIAAPPHNDATLDDERTGFLQYLYRELDGLEHMKKEQWERQRRANAQAAEPGPTHPQPIDTGEHFRQSYDFMNPVILGYNLVALSMNLLHRLPRRGCTSLLNGIRMIVQFTLQFARGGTLGIDDRMLLNNLHTDIRWITSKFNLDPHTTPYACCPTCYALYPARQCPQTCSYKATVTSAVCNTKLCQSRTINGKTYSFPVKTYMYQSMKQWMGRFLSRPDIEPVIDARRNLAHAALPNLRSDIWDAPVFRNFKDAAGRTFIDGPEGEGRYLFSLTVDGFNPFQAKEAKQKVSISGIYMVCMNLPPDTRYLPENMYLVGIIPGPSEPSLEEINHFLEPLVSDLLDFWHHGVRFTRTASYPSGRLVRCALIPLVCDLPAARQVSGHGSHSASHFCTFCKLRLEDIENLEPKTWPLRTAEEHRDAALKWKSATSPQERKRLFDEAGVRWSELLRLPYWDPILFTIVDTMHNHYLGLLKNHCRDIWGMSMDLEDGSTVPRSAPRQPSAAELDHAVQCLHHGSDETLRGLENHTLWHLCYRHNLRRSKKTKRLLKTLFEWRIENGYGRLGDSQVGADPNGNKARSQDLPAEDQRLKLITGVLKAQKALEAGKPEKNFKGYNKDVLVELCRRKGLSSGEDLEKLKKAQLASLLVRHRETSACAVPEGMPGPSQAAAPNRPAATDPRTAEDVQRSSPHIPPPPDREGEDDLRTVLGRGTLGEIHSDMRRTVVPSWVDPAPRNLGTKERGKLSADQWFSACTINFPFTLIRLWGKEAGRKASMLQNYMDLVTAVVMSSMLEIDDRHIQVYEEAMLRYLQGLKRLYKESEVKVNHHMALHVGAFLRRFGPVHSVRTFFSERMNFVLQRTNSNRIFGELEMTFMTTACRAANLRALLQKDSIRSVVKAFVDTYEGLFSENKRGTRLRETMLGNETARHRPTVRKDKTAVSLDDNTFRGLISLLNGEDGRQVFADFREFTSSRHFRQLGNKVVNCASLVLHGVAYKPAPKSAKDSNVVFRMPGHGDDLYAGRINRIFAHMRRGSDGEAIEEVFLSIDRLDDLSAEDAHHDDYRRFPHVGGRLYYDRYLSDPVVIRPDDIVSHFARTTTTVPQIASPCVHVLPLNRLLRLVTPSTDEDLEKTPEDLELSELAKELAAFNA